MDSSEALVAGKYRLTGMLGQGGMGSVWEGVHNSLGTRVAVKFIDAEYADSPEARNRFVNEAKAAAALRSKHVVQVYDHGVMEDGRPYIVMEFLSGEPLDKKLEREGRLDSAEAAQIVIHVARALTKAHAVGIVHRDLKPDNVFLVWDEDDHANVAKVVDFGIAKFTDTNMQASSATRTGSVLGTPHYMSPEQARGLRSVDFRSDLWSVGVIAYRCIVGGMPFDGEAVGDLLVKICTSPLPVPSQVVNDLPAEFDAWFAKALAREPDERFQSAAEMAEALSTSLGLTTRGPMPSSMLGSTAQSALIPSVAHSAVSQDSSRIVVDGSADDSGNVVAVTGAPITQNTIAATTHTPSLAGVSVKKSPPFLAIGAGVLALVAVAGVGVAFIGGSDEETAVTGEQPTEPVGTETASAEEPKVEPVVAADAGAAASGKNPETEKKPEAEAEPVKTQAKPAAVRQPRPVARPAPAPAPAPKPAAPKPKPKSGGGVDLGY